MNIEERQDWMRWEGTAVESNPTFLGRKDSFESTLSSYETSDIYMVPFSASSVGADCAFEEIPFDLGQTMEFSQTSTDPRRPMRWYSTLTAAEQQSLQDIAMPYRMLPQVNPSSEAPSPTSTAFTPSQPPSPESETRTRKTKKRKASKEDDDMPDASLSQARKRGHNAIEKRYRTNLNDKISSLRQGIPPLWRRASTESKSGDEGEDSDQETPDKKIGQQKYGKAAILTRALEYIQHLERTTQRLGGEVAVLKTRVGAFEMLAMSGSIMLSNTPAPNGLLIPKKETLESVQNDFKQIKHESVSVAVSGSKRNSNKGGENQRG